MAIVRAPRPDSGYTIIRNDVLRDSRLSYRARGLLAEILSRPDNWRVRSNQIADQSKEGRDAIRSALREIEAAGYITWRKHQDPKTGRWTTDTVVHDTPVAADDAQPKPENPKPGLPKPGNPGPGKPGSIGKNIKKEHKEPPVLPNQGGLPSGNTSQGKKAATTGDTQDGSTTLTRVVDAWKNASAGTTAQSPREVAAIASQALTNGVDETALATALVSIARDGHAVKDWRVTNALAGGGKPQPRTSAAVRKTRTITADRDWSASDYGSEDL